MHRIFRDIIFSAITTCLLGFLAYEIFVAKSCTERGGEFELLTKCKRISETAYIDFYVVLTKTDVFFASAILLAMFAAIFYVKHRAKIRT